MRYILTFRGPICDNYYFFDETTGHVYSYCPDLKVCQKFLSYKDIYENTPKNTGYDIFLRNNPEPVISHPIIVDRYFNIKQHIEEIIESWIYEKL
jgi:hypothetical protein